ncbi:hypothetical protein BCEN4_200005 [Burkholderia cenocepacia]|nr:hypothetical protein BCEN4_200005 [Burkholderia cenocepacia]
MAQGHPKRLFSLLRYRQALMSPADAASPRTPTQVFAPGFHDGRTIAAAPFGGCWPGAYTSVARPLASTFCEITCCCDLSAQVLAMHAETSGASFWLCPTFCTAGSAA